MSKVKVHAPNAAFTGVRGSVRFVDGVGEVEKDSAEYRYFTRAGYGIGGAAEQAASLEQPDSREATAPQQIGTPLRDAAVDPQEGDFLPPTNAGEADPHGPLVVAPQVHGEGPKGIKPGDVFVHDLEQQQDRETSLAQAVLVEGQDKPTALLEHYDPPAGERALEQPKKNGTKAAWVDYAVAQGMDRDEAEDMSRDDLAARYAPADGEAGTSSTEPTTPATGTEPLGEAEAAAAATGEAQPSEPVGVETSAAEQQGT